MPADNHEIDFKPDKKVRIYAVMNHGAFCRLEDGTPYSYFCCSYEMENGEFECLVHVKNFETDKTKIIIKKFPLLGQVKEYIAATGKEFQPFKVDILRMGTWMAKSLADTVVGIWLEENMKNELTY